MRMYKKLPVKNFKYLGVNFLDIFLGTNFKFAKYSINNWHIYVQVADSFGGTDFAFQLDLLCGGPLSVRLLQRCRALRHHASI